MKTVVILCVLVLALIGGAAAGEQPESPKKQVETCEIYCKDKMQLKEPTCKESCALTELFKTEWIGAITCSFTCNKELGTGAPATPATKACIEGCNKKYEDKVAELTLSCHSVCSKLEKDPSGLEKCKKICSPSLIYKKEMKEKAAEKAAP